MKSALLTTLLILSVIVSGPCHAQAEPTGTRRALIFCGHPGDAEFREQYAETIDQIVEALTTKWGFADEKVRVLFGTEQMLTDGETAPRDADGPCTLEAMKSEVKLLRANLAEEDALWVIFIGHSYYNGQDAWFNIAGPDPDTKELEELFKGLACRECVFWMTTSVSGFFTESLAADQRIVITATEADYEINATQFPQSLASVLAEPPSQKDFDLDQDGKLTLFDLYLTVCQNIAEQYLADDFVATEHAHLEDNGDQRGTEIQKQFLSEELGGTLEADAAPKTLKKNADGNRASTIPLSIDRSTLKTPEPEPESPEPDTTDS